MIYGYIRVSTDIRSVAAYRNLPEETIKTDFGAGGVLMGDKAIAAGMADELSDYEGAVAKLSTLTTPKKGEPKMEKKEELAITPEQIAAFFFVYKGYPRPALWVK